MRLAAPFLLLSLGAPCLAEELYEPFLRSLIAKVDGAIDGVKDGVLSQAEYTRAMYMLGLRGPGGLQYSNEFTGSEFSNADQNPNDGTLSRAEIVTWASTHPHYAQALSIAPESK